MSQTIMTATADNREYNFEMKWRKGVDPYEGKWPGPQKAREELADSMLIE